MEELKIIREVSCEVVFTILDNCSSLPIDLKGNTCNFICTVCKETIILEDLKSHLESHVDPGNMYIVEENEMVETEEKPFICYMCGGAFTDLESILDHMQIHRVVVHDFKESLNSNLEANNQDTEDTICVKMENTEELGFVDSENSRDEQNAIVHDDGGCEVSKGQKHEINEEQIEEINAGDVKENGHNDEANQGKTGNVDEEKNGEVNERKNEEVHERQTEKCVEKRYPSEKGKQLRINETNNEHRDMLINQLSKPGQSKKSSTLKSSLLNEKQPKNSGDKLHQCPRCNKSFPRKSIMFHHLRTHIREKGGNICKSKEPKIDNVAIQEKAKKCEVNRNENPSGQNELNTHSDHTEGLNKRDQCDKSFISNITLSTHERTHSGQKPHQSNKPLSPEANLTRVLKNKLRNIIDMARQERQRNGNSLIPKKGESQNQDNGQEGPGQTKQNKFNKDLPAKKRYKCDHCDELFMSEKNLHKHKKIHRGEKKVNYSKSAKLTDVSSRKPIHTERKNIFEIFSLKNFQDKHRRIHNGKKQHHCNKLSREKSNISGEKSSEIIDVDNQDCKSKQQTHKKPLLLKRQKQWQAAQGKEGSKNRQKDKSKEKINNAVKSKTEEQKCNMPLFDHKNAHTEPSATKIMASENRIVHTRDKPHQCDVFDKSFKQKLTLTVHQRRGEKPHQCPRCDKTFSGKTGLTQHLRTHTGKKPFVCDFCNKAFGRKCVLDIHRRTHSDEKPYQCALCNYASCTKSNIQRHLAIHTDNMNRRRFTCDTCKKSFTSKTDLNRHTQSHTGAKPYKCTKCQKRFTQAAHLKRHQTVHSGEKPFKCDKCGKAFSQKSDVTRASHLRTHSF